MAIATTTIIRPEASVGIDSCYENSRLICRCESPGIELRNLTGSDETLRINGATSLPSVALGFAALLILSGVTAETLDSNLAGGEEFQVGSARSGFPPGIASLVDGGFVVTWFGPKWPYKVFGRRYDSSGMPLSPEFQVDTAGPGDKTSLCSAGLANGGFVVTWHDGTSPGIFGRMYNATGISSGTQFLVNTSPSGGGQRSPCVAGLIDGGFVVTWLEPGNEFSRIVGRKYDATGIAFKSEFRLNLSTRRAERSRVAGLPEGGYVVLWCREFPSGFQGQAYNSSGFAVGSEFAIGVTQRPACDRFFDPIGLFGLAGLSDGNFVVTWLYGGGGGPVGIKSNTSGVAVDPEFQANTGIAGESRYSGVAGLADGGFVVTWANYNPNGVYGRIYDATGEPSDSWFSISDAGAGWPEGVSVAGLKDGGFTTIWFRGDSWDLFGRIFAPNTSSIDPVPTRTPTAKPSSSPSLPPTWSPSASPAPTAWASTSSSQQVFPETRWTTTIQPSGQHPATTSLLAQLATTTAGFGTMTLVSGSASSSNSLIIALAATIASLAMILLLGCLGCTILYVRKSRQQGDYKNRDQELKEGDAGYVALPIEKPQEDDFAEYASARVEASGHSGHYQAIPSLQRKSISDDYDSWKVIEEENAHWERQAQYDDVADL